MTVNVSVTCSRSSADLFLSSSNRKSILSSSTLILSALSDDTFLSSHTSCLDVYVIHINIKNNPVYLYNTYTYAYAVSLHQSDLPFSDKLTQSWSARDLLYLLLSRSACSCVLASSSSLLFSLYFLRKDDSSLHLSSCLLCSADISSWSLVTCSFWDCSPAWAFKVCGAIERKTRISEWCILFVYSFLSYSSTN